MTRKAPSDLEDALTELRESLISPVYNNSTITTVSTKNTINPINTPAITAAIVPYSFSFLISSSSSFSYYLLCCDIFGLTGYQNLYF